MTANLPEIRPLFLQTTTALRGKVTLRLFKTILINSVSSKSAYLISFKELLRVCT